jgi:hypothetical protein
MNKFQLKVPVLCRLRIFHKADLTDAMHGSHRGENNFSHVSDTDSLLVRCDTSRLLQTIQE